jgi:hypothetical protein
LDRVKHALTPLGLRTFLYSQPTGEYGPCVPERLGPYTGITNIADRTFQAVPNYTSAVGNFTYYHAWGQGFNRAYVYHSSCVNGGISDSYYGANEGRIRREVIVTQVCYGLSCQMLPTTYSSWSPYGW